MHTPGFCGPSSVRTFLHSSLTPCSGKCQPVISFQTFPSKSGLPVPPTWPGPNTFGLGGSRPWRFEASYSLSSDDQTVSSLEITKLFFKRGTCVLHGACDVNLPYKIDTWSARFLGPSRLAIDIIHKGFHRLTQKHYALRIEFTQHITNPSIIYTLQ